MSQIPSGGPVTIPVAVDAAQAHADMARLRAEWSKPIQLNVQGPGGAGGYNGPGGGGSMAVATANGPVTFAAQSSANYIGPGGSGFPSMGAGSYMSTAPIGSWGPSAGGGQLNQAASQLTQAVSQLSQVVNQLGSGTPAAAGGGGGGGGGAAGSRFMGLSTRGLARYAGAGFLLHEGLSSLSFGRDYGVDSAMAGNNPAARYAVETGLYQRIAGIPIVGQAADLLVDPSGRERLANQQLIQSAQLGESYMQGMASLRIAAQGATDQGSMAQFSGPIRGRMEAESRYTQRMSEIALQRSNDTKYAGLDTLRDQAMGKVQRAYDERMLNTRAGSSGTFSHIKEGSLPDPDWVKSEHEAASADYWKGVHAAEADDAKRRGPLDDQYKKLRNAAEAERAGQLGVIQDELNQRQEGWGYSRERANELRKQYPSQRYLQYIQRKEDLMTAGYIAKSVDGKNDIRDSFAATTYLDMQDAKLALEQSNFAKESARQRFSIQSDTESLNLQSGRDARTYGMLPGARGFAAELNSTVRRSQSAIEDALQAGRPDVAEALKARGAASVMGMRRRMLDSFSDEVVSPLQMGGGDLRQMNVDFWKAFNDAQRPGGGPDGGSLGNGGDSKAVSENTKQMNSKLDQIISLFQGTLSKLNINT